jgi:3-oxoacyl-[acyl-carrier-protein] synthase-3
MDTSDEWIRTRTGIRERHVSSGEDTSDLATQVAQQLLTASNLTGEALDFIIVATMTPDSAMPSTAARVQAAIGAAHAFAYDLTAACSGFVFALSQADKLITSGRYERGLVIGAEVLSKVIDWRDRTTAVLFGDGAGGVLLEADDTATTPFILAEKLQTDGSRGECLTSSKSLVQNPFVKFDKSENAQANRIQMDGRAVFDFAVRDVPKNIAETLMLSDLTAEEIDYFLLHQANSRLLDTIAKKLETPREKFLQNLEHYGNTSAASIPILLSEAIKNGKIKGDTSQKVVFTGFGGGLTWGTLVCQI